MGGVVSSGTIDIDGLRARFEACGQGHVFAFWERLDAAEREALVTQCAALDLERLVAAVERTEHAATGPEAKLAPASVERHPEAGGDASAFEAATARGEALLRAGRVGCLVVAGGQATRLGYPGPKGLFPIGPISERCLFEIQAQKLRRVRERSGAAIPWYVMTSPATDGPTRAAFAEHRNFGLPAEDVFFFSQGMVPSFDFEGRLILAEPGRLAENPDGHGGVIPALDRSGALADMRARGITTLFYYQVDNPLVRMADPAFIGFHAERGAEVSSKVVRKVDPDEKVGILAERDGELSVVEYTELEDDHRYARDDERQLRYWAGNIALHCFDTAFLASLADQVDELLPFHASAKKIPTVDAQGEAVSPEEPNGNKLERFVFDALPAASRVCNVEALRSAEFSPVKNARGNDSAETCRRDLVAQYSRWLAAAGIEIDAGTALEMDHAIVDSAADLVAQRISSPQDAGDFLRMESGARS